VPDFTVKLNVAPAVHDRVRAAVNEVFNQGYQIGYDQFHVSVEFGTEPDAHRVELTDTGGSTQTTWNVNAPETYGAEPDAELLAAVRAKGYTLPPADAVAEHRAMVTLTTPVTV
jgi:hypothetical protein